MLGPPKIAQPMDAEVGELGQPVQDQVTCRREQYDLAAVRDRAQPLIAWPKWLPSSRRWASAVCRAMRSFSDAPSNQLSW